jgi:hypothetical protein
MQVTQNAQPAYSSAFSAKGTVKYEKTTTSERPAPNDR